MMHKWCKMIYRCFRNKERLKVFDTFVIYNKHKGIYSCRRGKVLFWINVFFKSFEILRLMNFSWQILTDATFMIERVLKFAR